MRSTYHIISDETLTAHSHPSEICNTIENEENMNEEDISENGVIDEFFDTVKDSMRTIN